MNTDEQEIREFLAAAGVELKELPAAVEMCRESWPTLTRERVSALTRTLAEGGALSLAVDLSAASVLAQDPEAACLRAEWALRSQRFDDAVEASEVALARVLHDGLSVADFVKFALRGAPPESLLRVERGAVARLDVLHRPIALRWASLRGAKRSADAREMRSVCLKLFPERASVWAEAGNHAIDEQDIDRAERYYDKCLELDANWVAGLAGKAIVFELRKDWPRALQLRERVVRSQDSLNRDDPASLQRSLRFAAALGRVGRWAEAGALFRFCVYRGATVRVPSERPVLLRVFSRELYSPAIVATLLAQAPLPASDATPEIAGALRDAEQIGRLYRTFETRPDLEAGPRARLLGMCAWLAGDDARAYALLDAAEEHASEDLAIHYLLCCTSASLATADRENIERFAKEAAEAALASDALSDIDRFYAEATRMRGDASRTAPEAPAAKRDGEPLAAFERFVARRAAALAAGRAAYELAREHASELEAVVAALADPPASPSSTPASPAG